MRHMLDSLPAHMSVAMRRGSSQSRRRSLWTTYCAKSLQPIANVAALTPWQPCYVLLPVGGRCARNIPPYRLLAEMHHIIQLEIWTAS